jgi:DME family drug/metabolite transporter
MAEPVVATTLAVVVLHERLAISSWTGAALVVGCLVILSTRRREAPTKTAPSQH